MGHNCLSRKAVSLFDHLHSKEVFPNAQAESPLVLLCTVPTLLPSVTTEKRSGSRSLLPLLREL